MLQGAFPGLHGCCSLPLTAGSDISSLFKLHARPVVTLWWHPGLLLLHAGVRSRLPPFLSSPDPTLHPTKAQFSVLSTVPFLLPPSPLSSENLHILAAHCCLTTCGYISSWVSTNLFIPLPYICSEGKNSAAYVLGTRLEALGSIRREAGLFPLASGTAHTPGG